MKDTELDVRERIEYLTTQELDCYLSELKQYDAGISATQIKGRAYSHPIRTYVDGGYCYLDVLVERSMEWPAKDWKVTEVYKSKRGAESITSQYASILDEYAKAWQKIVSNIQTNNHKKQLLTLI